VLHAIFTEMDFIHFADTVAEKIRVVMKDFYRFKLLHSTATVEYATISAQEDLKATHKIDQVIKNEVLSIIRKDFSRMLKYANIFIEGASPLLAETPKFSLFLDPVDGSRSADQNIGDPCFMIAFSPIPNYKNLRFKDLTSCYIKGLHSGDTYFTFCAYGYYIPEGYDYRLLPEGKVLVDFDGRSSLALQPIILRKSAVTELKDACVIVRDGYGMRKVVSNKIDHRILNDVKHTFSYDITGLELCYLASGRDIVHLLVEARKHSVKGKSVGSDGFNLIPYPLIKSVGANIYSLSGEPVANLRFNANNTYDFIAACNSELLLKFLAQCGKAEALATQEWYYSI
jgi:fructose-1,6-bisphosphatase/inositol monophosphatase family enzyme